MADCVSVFFKSVSIIKFKERVACMLMHHQWTQLLSLRALPLQRVEALQVGRWRQLKVSRRLDDLVAGWCAQILHLSLESSLIVDGHLHVELPLSFFQHRPLLRYLDHHVPRAQVWILPFQKVSLFLAVEDVGRQWFLGSLTKSGRGLKEFHWGDVGCTRSILHSGHHSGSGLLGLTRAQTVQVRDKLLHFDLVAMVVLFGHRLKFKQIFLTASLPFLANLLHDVQGWNVGHRLRDTHSSLPHEEHVRSQGLLRHLVEERLVIYAAQLGKLLRETLFVPFCRILVFLTLGFAQLLPFFSDHLHNFGDFETLVLLSDDQTLLVSEKNIGRLGFLKRNILCGVQLRLQFREISKIYWYFPISARNLRAKTVLF